MNKKILLFLVASFLLVAPIQSRVRIRYIGPDNRTEKQKQEDKERGTFFGILVAIGIGGLVIWKKSQQ